MIDHWSPFSGVEDGVKGMDIYPYKCHPNNTPNLCNYIRSTNLDPDRVSSRDLHRQQNHGRYFVFEYVNETSPPPAPRDSSDSMDPLVGDSLSEVPR